MFKIVLLSVLLLMAAPAFGEYYEYTDKDGTVRFTDDPSVIPKDQQTVKTVESIQSEPQQDMTGEETADPVETAEQTEQTTETDTAKASNSGKHEQMDALNATREELRKTLDDLETEKTAIGPPPPKNANDSAKKEYNNKVSELNQKISAYQQRTKEFDEKIKAYNSQVGKK